VTRNCQLLTEYRTSEARPGEADSEADEHFHDADDRQHSSDVFGTAWEQADLVRRQIEAGLDARNVAMLEPHAQQDGRLAVAEVDGDALREVRARQGGHEVLHHVVITHVVGVALQPL
jgi:hypothetical protein